jgi:hypothetical protein
MTDVLTPLVPENPSTTWTIVLGIPTAVLLISWIRLSIQTPSSVAGKVTARISFLLLSASYLVFVGGVFFPLVLGAYYSDRRFATIAANIAVSVGVMLVVLWRRVPSKQWLALSSISILLLWLYAWAVNAVV